MTSTQADALQYVLTVTDEADLDRLAAAIGDRRRDLRKLRAAPIKVGSTVRLDNIRPKYLAGITGRVTQLHGQTCTINLTENSIADLRLTPRGKHIAPDAKEHYLRVPLETCVPVE